MFSPGRPKKYKSRTIVTFNTDQEIYDKFSKAVQRENESKSDALTKFMLDYIKEHGDSNNPQTVIPQFDREEVAAIPNIYEMNPQKWHKFYRNLSAKDYKKLDERVQFILKVHSEAFDKYSQYSQP